MSSQFLYNVHTPQKTFALTHKDGEGYSDLLGRIAAKTGLQREEVTALKEGKDGAGISYEFEGGRWSLEDDDDLSILHTRLPPKSTPSVTLHLTPPHAHAHFAPAPPSYSTASSTIKSRAQNKPPKSIVSSSTTTTKKSSSSSKPNGKASGETPKHHTDNTTATPNGDLGAPVPAQPGSVPHAKKVASATSDIAKYEKEVGKTADGHRISKPKSVLSTRSRRSKWGNDDAEPMGDVIKRKWLEFHANNGVRTVMGKVGDVEGVRMLLKSGYKGVYISRSFAIKHNLVNGKYAMGSAGYTGLKSLGNIPITVGSRTATHTAFINEEQHFDVVLGRTWLEKMAVKSDPLDQTALTYMDSGETIPCDLVVLKDSEGNVITIT